MRLALADIKKSILRRDGEVYIHPHLLRPRQLTHELEALIALYEAFVGKPRTDFPEDRPIELISDYRVARCLIACLSEWYSWQSPQWPGSANDSESQALAGRDIHTPGQLRLALYDYVNEVAGGYLSSTVRQQSLDTFAARCGLHRQTLDELLLLDSDERAVLCRIEAAVPTARELTTRYNQRVIEALLANAGGVEWLVPPTIDSLGTVVKRICFLARRMGVYYDIAFDDVIDVAADTDQSYRRHPGGPDTSQQDAGGTTIVPPPSRRPASPAPVPPPSRRPASVTSRPTDVGARHAAPASGKALPLVAERRAPYAITPQNTSTNTLDTYARPLHVTLYGPQEVMGAPNQYGERLARLCRALLGYRRQLNATGEATLSGEGLRGRAQVYLHGRPLTFALDDRFLHLLHAPGAADDVSADTPDTPAGTGDTFDSSLEQRLSAEFAALERAGEAHGWRLEHEPEPVIVGETIMIPDFALTRGPRRVYLEIAGYWRPDYRERKARKLAALRQHISLVVAAPQAARSEFAALTGDMPFLWYKNHVSAQALLTLVDHTYDDSHERLAALDLPRIRAEIAQRGHIPPVESMALLHVYTRSELGEAVARLREMPGSDNASAVTPCWIDDIGLCTERWRDALLAQLRALIAQAPGERLPLDRLRQALHAAQPAIGDTAESTVETLASQAGMVVVRESIFAAEVMPPHVAAATRVPATPTPRPAKTRRAQPQDPARRKQHSTSGNTRNTRNTGNPASLTQSSFASERASDGNNAPDTPTPTRATS